MRYLLLFLIFSFAFIHTVNGQTFLGKRFKAGVGLTNKIPLHGLFDINNSNVENHYDISIFPLKVEGRIGIAIASRIELELSVGYQGLQNSGVIINGENYSNDLHHIHVDSFMLRTNTVNFSGDFKFYSEYGPIGKYLMVGFGYSKSKSIVYPTLHRLSENTFYGQDYSKTDIYKLPTWESITGHYWVNMGIGKSILFRPNLFVDYGFKLTFYLANKNNSLDGYSVFADEETYNHQTASESLINRTILSNLQSSNLIQFYVTLGLIK